VLLYTTEQIGKGVQLDTSTALQMGKNKQKQKGSSSSIKVIGVLADESAIRTLKVANQEMGDAVSAISHDLKKHIDTTFGLRGDGLTIDPETVLIPG
jgi:hypothetical protein